MTKSSSTIALAKTLSPVFHRNVAKLRRNLSVLVWEAPSCDGGGKPEVVEADELGAGVGEFGLETIRLRDVKHVVIQRREELVALHPLALAHREQNLIGTACVRARQSVRRESVRISLMIEETDWP